MKRFRYICSLSSFFFFENFAFVLKNFVYFRYLSLTDLSRILNTGHFNQKTANPL